MRQIILLALGLVVGAAAGIAIVNTLRQRDAYPRGLMDVMQHHYAKLRNDARRGRCEDSAPELNLLRELSAQIATAVYPDEVPDAPFREFDARLRTALAAVPGADCASLTPIIDKIGATCDACHREYR